VTTIAQFDTTLVTVGVDTHLDVHVAVALDQLGRRLGDLEIPTTQDGYDDLADWAESFGEVEAFGIEGTGCYGAGLARVLRARGLLVVEVLRPKRQTRRHKGKSDLIDAEAAARAVLSGEAAGAPKTGDDIAEIIRVLRIQRQTAVKARTQAINSMRALLVTAPIERSLRALARRCQHLDAEVAELDADLDELVRSAAPALVALFGFGTDTAGQLIVTAGDNPDRLRSDAAFSMLCGSSPQPAGSGKTNGRHRLNRGGDRQANAALYRVALVRMRWHQPTRDYVERRTKEGKSKPEIIRCLKRYIARQAYTALTSTQPAEAQAAA